MTSGCRSADLAAERPPERPADPGADRRAGRAGAVPAWLLTSQPNRPAYHVSGQRVGGGRVGGQRFSGQRFSARRFVGRRAGPTYLERTLAAGAALLRAADAGSPAAGSPAAGAAGVGPARTLWLGRLDPRVKVLGLLIMLVAVAMVHGPAMLGAAIVLVTGVAWLSGLPMRRFAGRVLLVVPGMAAVLAMPSALSVITPGSTVVGLGGIAGSRLAITAQGLLAVATVTSRVSVSVALVTLVTMTTPWQRLLWGLGALGVPKIFVMIVAMAYRYLFLLLAVAMDMFEGRKVRTVTGTRHDRRAMRFVAASLGTLIGRASLLSEEVYQAMVARGYRGEAVGLYRHRIGQAELIAVFGVLAAAAGLVWGDHLVWG